MQKILKIQFIRVSYLKKDIIFHNINRMAIWLKPGVSYTINYLIDLSICAMYGGSVHPVDGLAFIYARVRYDFIYWLHSKHLEI